MSSSSKPNISQKSSSRPSSKHVDTFMQEQTAAKQSSDKPLEQSQGPVTPTQIKNPSIQTPTRALSIETPSQQETPRVNKNFYNRKFFNPFLTG